MGRRVRMTRHAISRAETRGRKKPMKVGNQIARRLQGMLQSGVEPDRSLAVKVPADDGLVAICVPSQFGGWDVVTVIREAW